MTRGIQRDGRGGRTAGIEGLPPRQKADRRGRHSAELVTDDVKSLRETLEADIGERISTLQGTGAAEKAHVEEKARCGEKEPRRGPKWLLERPAGTRHKATDKVHEPERGKAMEPELTAELDKFRRSRHIEMEM